MPSKKYQYSRFISPVGISRSPVISVIVSHRDRGNSTRPADAIIDSGADVTMMDTAIADLLGIDLSKCPTDKIRGVTGEAQVVAICEVKVQINNFPESKPFYAKAYFIKGLHAAVLLGQEDFFSNFDVSFSRKNDKFEITQVE